MSTMPPHGRIRASDETGFTLIEVLVVVVLMGFVLGIATTAVIEVVQHQRRQIARVEALNGAKTALERITKDLRAADPVVIGRDDAIEVTIHRGGGTLQRTYLLEADGTGLQRLVFCGTSLDGCTGTARRVLLTGIASVPGYRPFTYTDGAGVPMTVAGALTAGQREDLRTTGIRLLLELPESDARIDLSDGVTLRNWQNET